MDCNLVVSDELVERYLLGALSPAEQEAFEQHFFECETCFGELRSLQAIQEAVRAAPPAMPAPKISRGWNPWWGWLATGTAAASLVAVVLLQQSRGPEQVAGNNSPAAAAASPASPGEPEATSGRPIAEEAEGAATTAPAYSPPESAKRPGAVLRQVEVLARLARVEPPRYLATVLRGSTDEATLRFQEGMKVYATQNFRGTVPILREAAALDPSRPDIAFFLGASELLSDDTTGAVKELRRTIAMGDTPFLEEAHFYLAKAYLKQGDTDSARAELTKAKALREEKGEEVDEMLAELDALASE
jgi:tetratricopeptide (TPR) repeat protein